MREPTIEEVDQVADLLLGTLNNVEDVVIMLGLEEEVDWQDVEARLPDARPSVERCPMCEWWCELVELLDENGNVVGCPQCWQPESE